MTTSATLELASLKQTIALGKHLGAHAAPGDIITLKGSLGTGKTTLTQAIGQGLKVPESYYITSPTFALLHEYPGRIPLYHMDLYRLSGEDEIMDLGFEDYLYGAGLTVIEWPERLGALLPAERLQIELFFDTPESRRATMSFYGKKWAARFDRLVKINL